MSDFPEQPPSGGNTAVKIVLIVAGVLLGLAILCSGLTYVMIKALTQVGEQISKNLGEAVKEMADVIPSQATATMFFEHLRSGEIDAAYEMTTEDFQKSMTLADLKALVAKHPFLRTPAEAGGPQPIMVHKGASEHRFETNPPAGDAKQRKVTLVLRKVDEEWLVDRFTIGGEQTPEKAPEPPK
jgi:hypothetical protein